MLMSVRTRLKLPVRTFSSASAPFSAWTMLCSLIPSSLARLMLSSCLKVEESSTISKDISLIPVSPVKGSVAGHSGPSSFGGAQEVDKTFHRFQLAVGAGVEFRTHERRRRLPGQQLQQLVVERRQCGLVPEQPVNRDDADDMLLDLERDADADLALRADAVRVIRLALGGHHPFDALAARDAPAPDHEFALEAVQQQVTRLLVNQVDAELLGPDQVDQNLLDALQHLGLVERRVELEAGDVEVQQVLVLRLDFDEAHGEILVLLLDLGELLLEKGHLLGEAFVLLAQLPGLRGHLDGQLHALFFEL